MSRTYRQRCVERLDRLRERAEFLDRRMDRFGAEQGANDLRLHDRQERSAVLWAIEQIELFNVIEIAINDSGLNDSERVAAIAGVLDSRRRQTEADKERTPQLTRLGR